MTLRQLMIESIAEFEMAIGNVLEVSLFRNMSDSEILKLYHHNIWDEAYTDGHVEGYFKGIDYERQMNKQVDAKARLN